MLVKKCSDADLRIVIHGKAKTTDWKKMFANPYHLKKSMIS